MKHQPKETKTRRRWPI